MSENVICVYYYVQNKLNVRLKIRLKSIGDIFELIFILPLALCLAFPWPYFKRTLVLVLSDYFSLHLGAL